VGSVRLRGFVFCREGSAVWLQCWLCAVCAVGHIGCCVGGEYPVGVSISSSSSSASPRSALWHVDTSPFTQRANASTLPNDDPARSTHSLVAGSKRFVLNQSIKGPRKATRGQRRSHIPALPQRAANPASRSDAGLGGCERDATALVCETLR